MKTLNVTTNDRLAQVKVRGSDTDELTPRMARAALQIAAGLGAYGIVSDGRKAYKVTKTTRRLKDY